MPRIRSIKPEFFNDYEFVRSFSRDVRLFYQGLWVMACDDRGVFLESVPLLRKEIFGFEDDVTEALVRQWLDELVAKGRIVRYQVDGKPYGCVVHFLDHQKIDKPSRTRLYPIPPAWQFDLGKAWSWIRGPKDVPPDADPPRRLPDASGSPRRALAPDQGSGIRDRERDQDRDTVRRAVPSPQKGEGSPGSPRAMRKPDTGDGLAEAALGVLLSLGKAKNLRLAADPAADRQAMVAYLQQGGTSTELSEAVRVRTPRDPPLDVATFLAGLPSQQRPP